MALINSHNKLGYQTGKTITVNGLLNFNTPYTVTLSLVDFDKQGIYTLFNFGTISNFSNLTVVHEDPLKTVKDLKISGSSIIATVI